MTGLRGVFRVLGGAALALALSVTANQVLSEGNLSWTWMYVSYAVAVASLLYAEFGTAPPATDAAPRGRRRVYLRQLRANVRDMETVGIATQSEFVFRMRQVYVDVSVVPQPLHSASREPYVGSVTGGERRTLASVLQDAERDGASRVLAVIGGPGSGKTTLARNTALELCGHRWRPWKRRLPVLLYLRDHAAALLAEEPEELAAVAVSAGWLNGKVSPRWLERRLDRGRCVVLLDGLDEVADPAERARVVAWATRQIQRHPHNTYVVTSRPHGYESHPLPGGEVLQVRRFTWPQIERFLRQWSYATESRARAGNGREVRLAAERSAGDLLSRLRRQAALYDLAANPLLLTMTANVHRYRGQLPGSRAELYAEMCDVLLHRRSEARGLRDATGLTGPHKQHVAQHLALAMMKAKVRDWPVRDAARAIRRALRQVPGEVAPDVFLEEARKSGLLVEREQGVYGFAHLTLQEYLASAQLGTPRADSRVLTDSVEDPWWRETILLWSAANDATPVIGACLDRGTVAALALAFDCAVQARTVDPDVRDRLEALLAPPASDQPTDPARQRLLAGVLATRALHESIQLDDTTELCGRPVPRALYDLFVHEEAAAGRHHLLPSETTRAGEGDAAATGMHAGDAERFVDWLNTISGDAFYRLPTPRELGDPAAALVADLDRHTIWALDGHRTVLHQAPGAPWPYTPDPDEIRAVPVSDRRRLGIYLEVLAVSTERRERIEDWAVVLSTALDRVPEVRGSAALAPLELSLTLAVALALALTSDLVHASARALTVGRPHDSLDGLLRHNLELARHLRLGRLLHHAHALGITEGLDLEAMGRDHPSADDRDIIITLARRPEPTRALDIATTRALDRARDLDPSVPMDRVGALDYAGGSNRGSLFHYATGPDLDAALSLARLLDPGRGDVLATSTEPAIAHELGRRIAPPQIPDPLLALALVSPAETLAVSLQAFRTLFAAGKRPVLTQPDVLTGLDSLLTEGATESYAGQQTPDDPAGAVCDVRDLLRSAHQGDPGRWLGEALALVTGAANVLTQTRARTSACDAQSLASARTALLAAIAALRKSGFRNPVAIRTLHLAWRSLATLDRPASARAGHQILIVARTRS
ncbi:NACHT domain-containing protein [Streptomyces sp. MA5143a]|uniref:NACHT domain-containing protein n=1 Tax=Streptomyces sp. MA5143a TaxID=2083010 RepID=UPI000D2BCA8F|nr:NACHT domain-containing protein [Streptomyces sp. MA5143a]SPF05994.1 putative NTPase (NACHT family) [Streptomyces sp. MA5143a]